MIRILTILTLFSFVLANASYSQCSGWDLEFISWEHNECVGDEGEWTIYISSSDPDAQFTIYAQYNGETDTWPTTITGGGYYSESYTPEFAFEDLMIIVNDGLFDGIPGPGCQEEVYTFISSYYIPGDNFSTEPIVQDASCDQLNNGSITIPIIDFNLDIAAIDVSVDPQPQGLSITENGSEISISNLPPGTYTINLGPQNYQCSSYTPESWNVEVGISGNELPEAIFSTDQILGQNDCEFNYISSIVYFEDSGVLSQFDHSVYYEVDGNIQEAEYDDLIEAPNSIQYDFYSVIDGNYCVLLEHPMDSECASSYCQSVSFQGCTDAEALNFDPNALCDDGACEYASDLNGDGVVDTSDLTQMLGSIGCQGPDCTGDVNGDMVVNMADLIALLSFL